jgi:hypothetical protein
MMPEDNNGYLQKSKAFRFSRRMSLARTLERKRSSKGKQNAASIRKQQQSKTK